MMVQTKIEKRWAEANRRGLEGDRRRMPECSCDETIADVGTGIVGYFSGLVDRECSWHGVGSKPGEGALR